MEKKVARYSYSRLNTFNTCGWRYKLTYVDGHYIQDDNLANQLGTLIHSINERIGISIMAGLPIDYKTLKKDFVSINIPKTSPKDTKGGIYGVDILREKYHDEFYKLNDRGESYFTKCQEFLDTGIYQLENFLNANPNLTLVAVEKYFEFTYEGLTLVGYIDRLLYDNNTNEYVIMDIKTKDHPFDQKDLTTPMQFVIYSMAVKNAFKLKDYPTRCIYDLPICNTMQDAGTKGFVKRGISKLDKIIAGINANDFVPHPTPLCYWCPFSYTNPNQKEEAKKLCCYYSLWKPNGTAKAWEKMNEWEGELGHERVMKRFLEEQQGPGTFVINADDFPFDF